MAMTPDLVDEITKPEIVMREIKPENQIEPVSLTRRSIDRGLMRKLTFAKNPTLNTRPAVVSSKTNLKDKKPPKKELMSLIDYCHAKNIPFTEHEQRYYEIMRNKQNHKYWVDSWRKYCDYNIVDPPPKKDDPA
jgi:hypothetical protein